MRRRKKNIRGRDKRYGGGKQEVETLNLEMEKCAVLPALILLEQ